MEHSEPGGGARQEFVRKHFPFPNPPPQAGEGADRDHRTTGESDVRNYPACAAARSTEAAVWPNRMARSSAVRMPPMFGLTAFAFS
jgi:hypothetical protein